MYQGKLLLGVAVTAVLGLSGTGPSRANPYPTSEAIEKIEISSAQNELPAAIGTYNTIEVLADESDWQTAQSTTLTLPFHIEAVTSKAKWQIKDSVIVIGAVTISDGSLAGFDDLDYATPVGHANRRHVDQDGWWTAKVGDNSLATRARNACRVKRAELAQQGMKHDDILAADRHTVLSTEFRYVARVANKNSKHDISEANGQGVPYTWYWRQSQPIFASIGVTCLKYNAAQAGAGADKPSVNPGLLPGAGGFAAAFQVNQAALAITPKKYEAACPAKLHLNPTIEATGKGIVRYRFVDQLGNHSQEFQVNFTKSDVKFLDHVITINDKGKPVDLGFKAQAAQGGALGLAAPNNPNLQQGYFQLEVLSPHKKLSNIADYSVKCTAAAVGNLAAKPDFADLVIEDVQPAPNLLSKVFVKVTNIGTGPSTPTNLKATSLKNGQTIKRGTLVPVVAPGTSQVVLAQLGVTISSAEQITLHVDDPNRIKESNEANNTFQYK